ncbi:MAG: signal peptidase II [Lachnospiraceae bacterium]|nr:signal peptidase II [Lachnospiraceae bacterium]
MKKTSFYIKEIVCILILIVFDRASKIWATNTLPESNGIELIPGALKLYYLPNGNTGAAFGIFKGQMWLFVLVTVFVCVILLYALLHLPIEKHYSILHITIICITAGGLGNLIDRLMNGYVVDFIYFYLINFPIFNVADIYVTVSTVVLAVLLLFVYKEEDFKRLEEQLIPAPLRKKSDKS